MPFDKEKDKERFSVCQFFPDDTYEYVRKNVPLDEATKAFKHYTSSVGAKMGMTNRVIITDEGDCTVLEWINGKGIVFPLLKEGDSKN